MADAARDNNRVVVALLQNEDGTTGPWLADHTTGYALVALTSLSAPSAINTYVSDNNRVRPELLADSSSGAAVPWLANSSGGAWITLS